MLLCSWFGLHRPTALRRRVLMGLLDRVFGKRLPDRATNLGADGGTSTGRTFTVSQVRPAIEPLPVIPYHQAATEFLGGQVESCSQYHGQLVGGVRFHP